MLLTHIFHIYYDGFPILMTLLTDDPTQRPAWKHVHSPSQTVAQTAIPRLGSLTRMGRALAA